MLHQILVLTLVGSLTLGASADLNEADGVVLGRDADGFNYQVHSWASTSLVREFDGRDALSRPAISPDGKQIAFTGIPNDAGLSKYHLYVVDRDGSGLRRLTDPAGGDFDPAWSPDGEQIAFSRNTNFSIEADDCCQLYLVNTDGSGLSAIPNTQGGTNPSWSPEGDKLVYEDPDGIYTITPSGGSKTQIAGDGSSQPAWAPNGTQIAFIASTSGTGSADELIIHTLGGSDEVRYAPDRRLESPSWDGADIVLNRFDGFGWDDRSTTHIIRVFPDGTVVSVFNPNFELVLSSYAGDRCFGLDDVLGLTADSGVDGSAAPHDCFAAATAVGDFNNDGQEDLAIGTPGDVGGGTVNVLYGGPFGLTSSGDQFFHRDLSGIPGSLGDSEKFGYSLATGDFDRDGQDDLAIGVPGLTVGGELNAGGVTVIYGSAGGLTVSGAVQFSQDSAGITSGSEADDRFGESLAVGDFDGDGRDDLAVGVPGEGIGAAVDAGGVNVIYGSVSGLDAAGDGWFSQDSAGITSGSEADDRFGESLAVGDFDGDGRDDLAVGVPGEGIGAAVDAGGVNVIYGSVSGLDAAGDGWFSQDSAGITSGSEADDRFGESLAVGDFDGDGRDDLAVGVPGEGIGAAVDAGGVNVIYGSVSGLDAAGDGWFSQDSAGITSGSEADDRFGESLAVGDFDGDGRDDLAVGVPGEGIGAAVDAGGVNVIYGSVSGLDAAGDGWFSQDSAGITSGSEADDRFGESLAVGDFDGDGRDDLAVGVPGEGIGAAVDAGGVNVIYGSVSGLDAAGDGWFSQDS